MRRAFTIPPGARPPGALLPGVLLPGVLLLGVLVITGCPKPAPLTLPLDNTGCTERLVELFGDQSAYVVAVRPLVPGPLYTPEFLGIVDEITAAIEAQETVHVWTVRSVTTMPLVRVGQRGADMLTLRGELPLDDLGAAQAHGMVAALPFTVGDLVNPGETAFFIHVPRANVEGVDMDGLIDDLRHQFVDRAMIAVHGTPAASAIFYREVAGHGPSSDVVLVSFTVREDAETSLKTPEFLAALQASQRRLEGLTGVVGTYSVADDLMLTRRVVHKGDPGAYVLPHKQVEVVQLLLLYQMSGHAAEFGERIADGGEVTVMRVALTAMDDETRAEVVARIAQTLAIGFPEGVEARLCAP